MLLTEREESCMKGLLCSRAECKWCWLPRCWTNHRTQFPIVRCSRPPLNQKKETRLPAVSLECCTHYPRCEMNLREKYERGFIKHAHIVVPCVAECIIGHGIQPFQENLEDKQRVPVTSSTEICLFTRYKSCSFLEKWKLRCRGCLGADSCK